MKFSIVILKKNYLPQVKQKWVGQKLFLHILDSSPIISKAFYCSILNIVVIDVAEPDISSVF